MEYLLNIIKFLKKNAFQWNEWKLTAHLKISSDLKDELVAYDNADNFQILFENSNYNSIDINDVVVGELINVTVELPRSNEVFVAKDVDDLISQTSMITKVPNYIIYSVDFVSWRDEISVDKDVFAYEKICEFIQLCLSNDVLEQHHSVNKLVLFFTNSKLIIPCDFKARSIHLNVGKDFDCIIQKFNSDKHNSDRVHMLRSSLYKTLKNCNESKRLIHLVSKSSNFVRLFEHNYDLFISQFCFDSEKDKIFEAKREFLSKLSQLLSGIQGKLLAIPLSLVLILGQMKTKPEDSPLLVNSLIIISSIVFTTIMLVLLFSQLTAISAIHQEVKSKKIRFELELADLYEQVETAFNSVLKQCLYNRIFIYFMLCIVVVGLFGSIITYIMLTPEIRIFCSPLYNYIAHKWNWILKLLSMLYETINLKFNN